MFKSIGVTLAIGVVLFGLNTYFEPFGRGSFAYFSLLANIVIIGLTVIVVLGILVWHLLWRAYWAGHGRPEMRDVEKKP